MREKNIAMRSGIIVAALVLVNGLGIQAIAAGVSKKKVEPLVQWLLETGKDRDDFDHANAMMVGREPGNGKSKARGAPATGEEPDRFIHLFLAKSGKPDFIAVQQVQKEGKQIQDRVFRIAPSGKIQKAVLLTYDVDDNGMEDVSSGKFNPLKLTKQERALIDADLDFWLARAKQDSKPDEAKPNGAAKP